MATYVTYIPKSPIAKAMFNFDMFGLNNFKLNGVVRVSVSDAFSYSDYAINNNYSLFSSNIYTSMSNEITWTSSMLANVQEVLTTYSQFANIAFQWIGNFDSSPPGNDATPNPEDVGRSGLSDINITWIYRSDVGFSGISGGSTEMNILKYVGGEGDIFLNAYYSNYGSISSLNLNTAERQTLQHELGHSLGLSHPHSAYANGIATISADYAATKDLGFSKLGFKVTSAADMNKEYFSIMSYDDQQSTLPNFSTVFQAYTPMILDVIALQEAYGEGGGTHGVGNDTIVAGTGGYRTYFDTGGNDTIDLRNYVDGAYLNMGQTIEGAGHLVGVSMSLFDGLTTILNGGNPANLRWYYGEIENASGSVGADLIIGNALNNTIAGFDGDDLIDGLEGADWLFGGDGADELFGGTGNDYLYGQTGNDSLNGDDGADIVSGGDGNDTVHGGNGDDGIYGDAGNDAMFGDGGGDFIAGGDGVDTMHGGEGQDWEYGEYQNDTIYGDAGNDFLFGNFGDDTLVGGAGNDTLIGGNGADYFVFAASEGEDFVVDFSLAQGDKIFITSGTNGITTSAMAFSYVHDVGGNAVVDLGGGNNVMLMGVTTASLHATDFVVGPA